MWVLTNLTSLFSICSLTAVQIQLGILLYLLPLAFPGWKEDAEEDKGHVFLSQFSVWGRGRRLPPATNPTGETLKLRSSWETPIATWRLSRQPGSTSQGPLRSRKCFLLKPGPLRLRGHVRVGGQEPGSLGVFPQSLSQIKGFIKSGKRQPHRSGIS